MKLSGNQWSLFRFSSKPTNNLHLLEQVVALIKAQQDKPNIHDNE